MSVRKFTIITGLALIAAVQAANASAPGQSAAEIEDIGVLAPSAATADPNDPKAVKPAALPSKWRFSVGARAQYTTNAELSGSHSSSDVIFFPNLELAYSTSLGKGFSFDSVARIESGVYSVTDDRNFIGYSLTSTLGYRPKPNLPRVFVGFEPYRYDSLDSGHYITEALGVNAGVDWGVPFNNGNSLAFVGYTFTEHFAAPSSDTRGSHAAVVGVTHMIRPQLFGQLFYQYQYSDYENISRDDNRHTVGVSLTWQINRTLFTTLSGSFVDNESSQDNASYQSAGVSLGLNFQY